MDMSFTSFALMLSSHFSGEARRVSLFKECLKEQNLTYRRFEQKADTRWLTLGRQAKWICDMWPALVAYFRSVDDADVALENVFQSEERTLQYRALSVFMKYALGLFNKFNTATQEQALCVTELGKTLSDFKLIFESLKRDQFFGEETRDALEELSDNAMDRERAKLEKTFLVFYDKSLEYFSKWFKYVDNLSDLSWLQLEETTFKYDAISASYRKYTDGGPVGRNLLYAEFTELRANLGKLRGTAFDELSVSRKWVQLLRSENIVQIRILVGALMSIFPSNAYCESVFSMVNNYWTPQKSQLQVDSLNAIISLKCNCDFTCQEAFEYFLGDPALLADARKTAKYHV